MCLADLPSISPFLKDEAMLAPISVRPIFSKLLAYDKENAEPKEEPSNKKDAEMKPYLLIGVKKPLTKRDGDWLCLGCKNINFAFRDTCNRCQQKKQEYLSV